MELNRKPLLLIVDDEPANLHVLVESLGNDYVIKAATNGTDAIGIAQDADKPDLILLDVMMPEISGYEVCKTLKEDETTKDIPVIFVTAMELPEWEVCGLELGAVDYICKPINIGVLKARVSTHIKLKQLQEQLVKLSNQDKLTGISNRRHFDEYFDVEWRRNMRNQTPLTIIMADIDYFKRFNDTYGHLAGDVCLVKVAEVLNSVLQRPGDLAARYGGEEFVGVLSNTNAAGAHQIAEAFRSGVEKLAVPHSGSPLGCVTASCGVAAMVPDAAVLPSELIALADKHLYVAKDSGRNVVISSRERGNELV
ncbi:MAG: diguanylate cyclase response regulator [Candidatus Brocadiaceae bacterium]|nr:diguanylate cyclase response regulator [Candidatus Brocadiaceae bacterium]